VRRLAWFVPIMLLVGTITFVVTSLLPGDPAAVMLGSEATPAQVHELRQAMGLDRPLPVRYRDWLWGAARLDFGDSIFLDRPVSEAIGDRIVPTAQLTLYSLVIALGLGLPAGVIAALYRNSILDRLLMLAAVSGIAIARFFLGIVLILVFAVHLGWLPAGGYQPLSNGLLPHFRSMVMPAVAVSVSVAGLLARLTRSSMLQALGGDYVRTALASGLSRPHIVVGHTFKNALAPTIAVLGVVLGDLLVGAVIVETVFGLPGMGQLVANSIARRDLPVLQGVVMVATLVTLSTSLLVDVVSEAIDPRIRSDRR
jgi:peptide/nickel transport system permease protein